MTGGKPWADEERVGDFIVGTMIFAIVLTMGKIGVFGFEPVWFRSRQFNGDCTLHCPCCSECSKLYRCGVGKEGEARRGRLDPVICWLNCFCVC